ncbi:MAG: EamA family transporter [Planctomycetes bacterium]|nr:EamA family transporter [Planctomycetota bacterium]
MSSPHPSPLKAFLLTALLCLIWGSTWVVIKSGLEDLPTLGSAAARFTLAALCMSGLCALFAAREGGARPGLALTLVLGSLNFAGSYGIVYWTESKLPSALVSVLWAVYPLLQAIVGHVFLPSERVARAQVLGFGLGFLGVAALFATDLRGLGPAALPAGAVLLLSPLISAIGTTYVKKHGGGTSSMLLNRNAMFVGAALLWIVAFASERGVPFHWTGAALFSLAYLAVFGTVVAFGLYFWLLRHSPANRLSVIAYVTPAVALVLGLVVRQEPVGPWTLAGLGLILLGVWLVHRSGLSRAPAVARPPANS